MILNRKVAFVVIALGAFTGIIANTFNKSTNLDPVGPAKYPIIVSVLIILLGVLMFITTFMKKRKVEAKKNKISDYKSFFSILAAAIGYILLFHRIGYIATNTLFLIVIVRILGEKDIKKILLFSILTTLGLYIIFKFGLNVLLPPFPLFK